MGLARGLGHPVRRIGRYLGPCSRLVGNGGRRVRRPGDVLTRRPGDVND